MSDILEQERNFLEHAEVSFVRGERVELPDELKERRDALRLMAGIEDEAAELASRFKSLEALQGRVDLASAAAIEIKRPHDGAHARQELG